MLNIFLILWKTKTKIACLCLSVCPSVRPSIQSCAQKFRWPLMGASTNSDKSTFVNFLPTGSQLLLTFVNFCQLCFQLLSTSFNFFQLLSTYLNLFQLLSSSFNLFQLLSTSFDFFQLLSTFVSLCQLVSRRGVNSSQLLPMFVSDGKSSEVVWSQLL